MYNLSFEEIKMISGGGKKMICECIDDVEADANKESLKSTCSVSCTNRYGQSFSCNVDCQWGCKSSYCDSSGSPICICNPQPSHPH